VGEDIGPSSVLQVGGGVSRGVAKTRKQKGSETSLRVKRTGVRETRINCEGTVDRVNHRGQVG
jgi:hypothetical protein